MVGVIVRDAEGQLTTFAATILGVSRRVTTKVGAAWVWTGTEWGWAQVKSEGLRHGSKSRPTSILSLTSLPAGRPGESWRVTWLEGGAASFGRSDWEHKARVTDLRRLTLTAGVQPPDPVLLGKRLEEAFGQLSSSDREDLQPMTPVEGAGGYQHQEGRLVWLAPLVASQRPPENPFILSAPMDNLPSTLWSSAKGNSPAVLGAVASEESGWGFIVTPQEVKLAPYRRGRFGVTSRVQSWASQAVVGWWQVTSDIEARDQELRSSTPDPYQSPAWTKSQTRSNR
jgi:hypothetical protein